MIKEPLPTPEQARVEPWFKIDGDKNLRLDYPLNKSSVVYDVGGYLGEWATPIWDKYRCRIEIFEPVGSFVTVLEDLFKANEKISIHPFGLAGKTKSTTIQLEDASSSTFKKGHKNEIIKLVKASDFIAENQEPRIDLIKINIEGGEYELLDNLIESGDIRKIDNIQVQFHIFVPNAPEKRFELQKRLSRTHNLIYNYPFIWEGWRLKGEA